MQTGRRTLSEWFGTPLGAHLIELELGHFDREVADVFGFNALQLGLPEYDFLRANRIAFRTRTAIEGAAGFLSDPCALPLRSGTIGRVPAERASKGTLPKGSSTEG